MPTSDFPLTPTSVPCVPRALSFTSEICSPAGEGCSRGGQLLRPSSLYICRRKKEKQNYLCAGFRDKRVGGEPWADFHMKSAEGGWACLKRQVLGRRGSLRWGLQRGDRTPNTGRCQQDMPARALSLCADASPAVSVDGAVFPFVLQ